MAALINSVTRELMLITERRSSLLTGCKSVAVNSRRLIRGLRRRPVAVLYSGDERESVIKRTDQSKKLKDDPGTQTKHPSETAVRRDKEKSTEMRQTGAGKSSVRVPRVTAEKCSVREQLGGLRFDKALPGDKRLAKMVSIAHSRAFREQESKVLLEGKRLICDAIAAGASPQMLFFSRVENLRELPLDQLGQASLIKVKFEDIKLWSDVVTPQGVIAIFSKPDESRLTFPKDLRVQSIPLFLICDNVRDPGSLGTILRSAAAAGCNRVLLTQGCVDPWEPKVLRAAMGAHFRLPVFSGLNWDSIKERLPKAVTVHVADDSMENMMSSYTGVQMPGKMIRDNFLDESGESDDEPSLPCVEQKMYHENWARRNTALVISGETCGLSSEALQMAHDTDGYKLFVPMAPGVRCLNSAMMASILLFEGRRQLMEFSQKAREAKSTIK